MPKALQDVTVLDFSHLLQGPFATQLLGDMGANVIKIERPGQGDLFRTMTFKNRWVGGTESPNFLAWNRNKRSLAIDLKAPEAKDDPLQDRRARPTSWCRISARACSTSSATATTTSARSTRASSTARAPAMATAAPTSTRPGQDMLIQGLTGLARATGRGDGAAGAGRRRASPTRSAP